jgi:hypothetical protein
MSKKQEDYLLAGWIIVFTAYFVAMVLMAKYLPI